MARDVDDVIIPQKGEWRERREDGSLRLTMQVISSDGGGDSKDREKKGINPKILPKKWRVRAHEALSSDVGIKSHNRPFILLHFAMEGTKPVFSLFVKT